MKPETQAIIRGMWRQGATPERISVELGIKYYSVVWEIENYFGIRIDNN